MKNKSRRHLVLLFSCLTAFSLLLAACTKASPSPTPASTSPTKKGTCPNIPEHNSQAALALYPPAAQDFKQYALIEFDLSTTTQVQNPFDPAQVDLVVNYTTPDGKTWSIPAFWYLAYDSNGTVPCGKPGWKARLTPTMPGKWNAQAEIKGKGITSDPVSFEVAPSSAQGFIRLSPKNSHYLAFEDGKTFFPIGLNMGWWNTNPLDDYKNWLDQLHANQGNAIRVWMASWSYGIEWFDTGLGDYTNRLDKAWDLDQLLNMAQERGIYIELVLLNHGAFSTSVNPEWNNNPYNAAKGGPCKKPDCFSTDPQAKALFQRRLRYILARWGYSPNILAWEWWNEEDWTPITPDLLAPWITEMTAYLRQYDPYHHLVSTSFAHSNPFSILTMPEIDFTQYHLYDSYDPIQTFPARYRELSSTAPGKPVLFAEFGSSTGGENAQSPDQTGIHLHTGLWAATFSGFASPAWYWWWDTYVSPLNLWGHYASLARFLDGVDLALYSPAKAQVSTGASALALRAADRAMVWVKNDLFQHAASLSKYSQPLQGIQITLKGMPDGAYRVRWYDASAGKWLDEAQVTVQGGVLTLTAPDFNKDLAARIEP